MKRTTKDFIQQANKLHKDKYNYSLVEYINAKSKVKIVCTAHGTFEQSPDNHLRGQGCPMCGRKKASAKLRLTSEQFIKKAKRIHKNKYDYSLVDYKNTSTPVEIICPQHGSFLQRPNDHLTGYNCFKCANKEKSQKMTQSTSVFIEKAKTVHGNKYNYSFTNYINSNTKVSIVCPHHGEFRQTPNNHLRKDGCPTCSHKTSFKEQEWLDSLNLPNNKKHRQVKIKLGNGRTVKVDGFDSTTNTVYEFYGDFWHGNPKQYDPDSINPITKKSYRQLYEKTLQREQLITQSGYNLITEWETN